jgi:3-dehydroquinate dehydratase type I
LSSNGRIEYRPKLCTSIFSDSCEEMAKKAARALSLGSDLIEFRLDSLYSTSLDDILKRLRLYFDKSILTVRPASEGGGYRGDEVSRIQLMSKLAQFSPLFIDVELRAIEKAGGHFVNLDSSRRIVSWHETAGTPSYRTLRKKVVQAANHGGIVKIVTLARTVDDNVNVLSLYSMVEKGRLIAFCMGKLGTASRVISMRLGSPLVYCSLPGEDSVPGQLPVTVMKKLMELLRS